MIIVTGSLIVKQQHLESALSLSIEHVNRSLTEPGCISHGVHQDSQNPLKLFFYEQWSDNNALMQHFAVPASQQFAKKLGELADVAPQLNIYEAQQLR